MKTICQEKVNKTQLIEQSERNLGQINNLSKN